MRFPLNCLNLFVRKFIKATYYAPIAKKNPGSAPDYRWWLKRAMNGKKIYLIFMDFEKAFDSFDQDSLWNICDNTEFLTK